MERRRVAANVSDREIRKDEQILFDRLRPATEQAPTTDSPGNSPALSYGRAVSSRGTSKRSASNVSLRMAVGWRRCFAGCTNGGGISWRQRRLTIELH